MNSLFASTARGLEELLKTELENLGAVECQVVQGGVHFKGDTRLVYQSLMWSRLASRIMLRWASVRFTAIRPLSRVQAINWTEMFNLGATFAVHFSVWNDTIRNSQYGAMKVKDAIVDAFTRKICRVQMLIAMRRISALTSGCIKKLPVSPLISSGDGLHLLAIAIVLVLRRSKKPWQPRL
ncbi:putative RNA methylase [Escherichia coli]|uniref:Putative RNA methylase n=1 Tax=Escherichia coli TaxID=562 RepID=A0A376VK65_ECOLX|nr:putative RNA methylase [Escherichia coli]